MSKLQNFRNISVSLLLSITLLTSVAQPVLAREKPDEGRGTVTVPEKVKPLTYDECVTKYSKVTDYKKLQEVINKLSDKRIESLNKTKEKINERNDKQLSTEYKTTLNSRVDADIKKITDLKEQSASIDSASALVKNMCEIYTTTVFSKMQARYLIALGTISNIDRKINEVLEHPANQKISGPLKDDASSKIEEAKKLIAANDALVPSIQKAVLSAKTVDELNSALSKEAKDALVANAKKAIRLHTEAWAIRALGRQLNPTAKASIVGDVHLFGKEGNVKPGRPIPEDGAARPAVKAIAEIKINGKTYTKEVIRDDNVSKWRYSKPDNFDDNETLENESNNIDNDKNPPKNN